MELISAAKMRKSQQKALSSRPYTNTLAQIIWDLKPKVKESTHKLLRNGKGNSDLVILLTTDRGQVGGLNVNIFKETYRGEFKNPKFVAVGKKGTSFVAKNGNELVASFLSDELPFLDLARTLSKLAIDSFTNGEAQNVYLVLPHFESTVKQIPQIQKILPIELEEEAIAKNNHQGEILFEPNADRILTRILPHLVLTNIYQALLEAKASEHSARMVAMKNATDAAHDLVDDLTLTYNQARQETITKELLDIVTAQSAFE